MTPTRVIGFRIFYNAYIETPTTKGTTMLDLSNSVILPREDYQELSEAAWNQTPTAIKDRLAQTAQTTIVCTLLVGAISGGMYVYYKLQSKLEDKKHEQRLAEIEAELNPKK